MPTLEEARRDIQLVPITQMRRAPWNPRKITDERLRELRTSMDADPGHLWARPQILVPDLDGVKLDVPIIIAGNHRWLAAGMEPPWTNLPAFLWEGLSEDEAKVIALRDNQGYAVWDDASVAEILRGLDKARIDLSLTGFSKTNISELLARFTVKPPERPLEEAKGKKGGKPKSKRGEIYELGPHRLLCGDATIPEDAAKLMAGGHAELLFTSPPYGDARDYDPDASSDSDLAPEHLATFLSAFAPYADLLAVNLGILRRDYEVVPYWEAYHAAAREAGLKLLAWNVWDRDEAGTIIQATAMFPLHHEFVFVYGTGPIELNKTVKNKGAGKASGLRVREADGSLRDTPGPATIRDFRALSSVLRTPPHKGTSYGGHPAVFPLAFAEAYIEAATKHGEIVIDPFGGSGTTLIAAARTGRRAFVVEQSASYCDAIRDRWRDYELGGTKV